MIGHPAAAQRALQHKRQLLSHAVLTDQLAELPGPQSTLDDPIVGIRQR